MGDKETLTALFASIFLYTFVLVMRLVRTVLCAGWFS